MSQDPLSYLPLLLLRRHSCTNTMSFQIQLRYTWVRLVTGRLNSNYNTFVLLILYRFKTDVPGYATINTLDEREFICWTTVFKHFGI